MPADEAAVGAAEDGPRQLGAAGAHQAGEADDLAAADEEARALAHQAVLRRCGWPTVQFFTSKSTSPIFGLVVREPGLEVRPTMPRDDAVLVDAVRLDVRGSRSTCRRG